MNDVKSLSPLIQKRTEGVQRYIFQLRQMITKLSQKLE